VSHFKGPHGRPENGWKDSKINLKGIAREVVDWIIFIQDRDQWCALVTRVINFRAPQNVGNFVSSWATVGSYLKTQFHGTV
jgi:hypothetical protein